MVSGKIKAGTIIVLAFLIFVTSSGCATQEKAKADTNIPASNLTLKSTYVIQTGVSTHNNGVVATYHDNDNNNTVYVAIGADGLVSGISAIKE
jgi:hypothetical protein